MSGIWSDTGPPTRHLALVARWFGALVALLTLGLYLVLAFFNPYTPSQLTPATTFILVVSVAALLSAAWGKPLAMLAAFTAWFVPVGLYTLGTPGIFRLIGILNLVYLLAGIILLTRDYADRAGYR